MSELNLGRIRMVPKGAWSASAAYKMLDTVTSDGSSYVCIADAVAGTLLSDTTKWQLVAEKGAKGDKGDTGLTGDTGAKGDPGTKGETGAAATIAVGTVSSGANAAVTNSGTAAAAKFNFVLPKGDKGDRGAQGASITNAAMNAAGELVITIGA